MWVCWSKIETRRTLLTAIAQHPFGAPAPRSASYVVKLVPAPPEFDDDHADLSIELIRMWFNWKSVRISCYWFILEGFTEVCFARTVLIPLNLTIPNVNALYRIFWVIWYRTMLHHVTYNINNTSYTNQLHVIPLWRILGFPARRCANSSPWHLRSRVRNGSTAKRELRPMKCLGADDS